MLICLAGRRNAMRTVLVTGGAGYIGSMLAGVLLDRGDRVTVVDKLLFGGESLLAYNHHDRFRFTPGDGTEATPVGLGPDGLRVGRLEPARYDAVVHLAAIVGFPACQAVGKDVAWLYNTTAVERGFDAADTAGGRRSRPRRGPHQRC